MNSMSYQPNDTKEKRMIQATSLSNSVIGGPNRQMNGIRFKAAHNSPLAAFRCYVIDNAPGYSMGNGGVLRASLYRDGTQGYSLGTLLSNGFKVPDTEFPDPSSGKGRFPLVCFNQEFQLKKDSWYWIVIDNVDPDPEHNYFSMDYLVNDNILNQVPDMQIYLAAINTHWHLVTKLIPSPIVLHYANSLWQGLGYIDAKLESGAAYGFPAGSAQ